MSDHDPEQPEQPSGATSENQSGGPAGGDGDARGPGRPEQEDDRRRATRVVQGQRIVASVAGATAWPPDSHLTGNVEFFYSRRSCWSATGTSPRSLRCWTPCPSATGPSTCRAASLVCTSTPRSPRRSSFDGSRPGTLRGRPTPGPRATSARLRRARPSPVHLPRLLVRGRRTERGPGQAVSPCPAWTAGSLTTGRRWVGAGACGSSSSTRASSRGRRPSTAGWSA